MIHRLDHFHLMTLDTKRIFLVARQAIFFINFCANAMRMLIVKRMRVVINIVALVTGLAIIALMAMATRICGKADSQTMRLLPIQAVIRWFERKIVLMTCETALFLFRIIRRGVACSARLLLWKVIWHTRVFLLLNTVVACQAVALFRVGFMRKIHPIIGNFWKLAEIVHIVLFMAAVTDFHIRDKVIRAFVA